MLSATVFVSVIGLLLVAALILVVLNIMGKAPLWLAVGLLVVVGMLSVLPVR